MSMFDVTVYTETGSVYSARSFDIDEKKAPAHGDSFDTKIEYHGSTTTVTVPITRSKVVQYKVGYPTKENVLATIYNNGDLEFTGSGNTMNFANGDTPWADEDYTYVIFKDEITPTNVDYWFEGNTALTGCETLPKSIESARGTFQGCENLKKTPSFFQCSSLKIITDCFSGCTSLEQSDPLPVSVMEADGAFEDCIKLTKAPDMTKTNALSSINAIFKGCMSLVDAPVIPDSVLDMSEAFLGDSNIYTASAFPESVEDISSAYADKYLLDIGDEITLKEAYEDDTYTFSIEGIYDYEGGLTVFLPQDTFNELFDLGSDYFSGYLSDSEITDIDQKYISSVIDLDSLSKISRQLNVSMGSMMYLLDGFSIVLFMILIYLLSKIIIEKNAQSISMTKILGYSDREISSLYLLSTTIMVVVFLLLSFPIETVLMNALFRGIMISSISGWIPLYIDPVLYVKMFLLGFGTYLLVALIEYRRIKKVPMDQALKNIE